MMKKLLSVLALSVLSAGTVHAQSLSFGVKGGLTISTQSATYDRSKEEEEFPDPTFSSVTGFAAGAFAKIGIAGFAIQPELLYVTKGSKGSIEASSSLGSINITGESTLNYLEIPVLFKYELPLPAVKPNIFAGPAASFLVSSKLKQTTKTSGFFGDQSSDSTISPDPNIKNNDFGIVFGAGVDFSVGGSTLTLDARYNLGLANVYKKDEEDDGNHTVYNRSFMIMVGWGF